MTDQMQTKPRPKFEEKATIPFSNGRELVLSKTDSGEIAIAQKLYGTGDDGKRMSFFLKNSIRLTPEEAENFCENLEKLIQEMI